jgi:hypothetical protein
MKMALVNYSKTKKYDNFDTPDYAVKPLLPYVDPSWKIWEPTDTTGKSNITKLLRENGNHVMATNKKSYDFLIDTPDFNFDCIITNPPYSIKNKFIERCVYFGKRWALLMPITVLEGIPRGKIFTKCGKRFGVLILDRRVEYTGKQVWFNSSWFCYGLLHRQLVFAEMDKLREIK